MRELLILLVHLLVTFAKLLRAGGVRTVAAESLLLKHQLVISNRSRHRAPNLTSLDRFVFGLTTLFISPHRIPKLAAILKPATLLKFHKTLVDRKYHLLFSASAARRNPGPKGPSAELIAAIVEMKSRNLKFGYLRIAQQISHAFGVAIDKDTVRRVLAKHYRPNPSALSGPSWLAFFAQSKDSLFSVDLSDATGELSRSRCSSSSFFRSAADGAAVRDHCSEGRGKACGRHQPRAEVLRPDPWARLLEHDADIDSRVGYLTDS